MKWTLGAGTALSLVRSGIPRSRPRASLRKFWQRGVEWMSFALAAFGVGLFIPVTREACALRVGHRAFRLEPSSAPTLLVGPNEKNARQRSSGRGTARRTRRRSETLRSLHRNTFEGTEKIQHL